MSSGAKQLTRVGFEASPGVIATTWNTFAFTTNGLDASAQTTESQTIKDSRIAAGTLVTGVEVQGDIESEWAYGIQDKVLELIAFNAWNSNVLTFGGTTRKTLSIIRGFSDIDNFQVFTGCHINQWTLSI
ncbi:MAG: phage tail tube protein, partial [Acinetobacter sp.]|nr:phage tail tube protein [Acinetobacter sp.]